MLRCTCAAAAAPEFAAKCVFTSRVEAENCLAENVPCLLFSCVLVNLLILQWIPFKICDVLSVQLMFARMSNGN